MATTNIDMATQVTVSTKKLSKVKVFGYSLSELASLAMLFGTAIGCYFVIFEIMQNAFR